MGTNIILKNCDFSGSNLGFEAPVSAGLLYFNFFGKDAATTKRNLAGGLESTIVGSPSYTQTGTVFSSMAGANNHAVTGYKQAKEMTFLFAAKLAEETQGFMAGTYRAPRQGDESVSGGGFYIGFTNEVASGGKMNPVFSLTRYNGTPGAAYTPNRGFLTEGLPVNAFRAYAAKLSDAAKKITFTDLTTGNTKEVSWAGVMDLNTANIAIGSSTTQDLRGAPEMGCAGFYDRVLSDDEIAKMYASIKAYFARLGIAV